MTLLDTHISDIWKNIAEIIAIVIGGIWVYWKFFLNRENESKIELDLDIKLVGKSQNTLILELSAVLTNKGLVRHIIENFSFDFLYLSNADSIIKGDEIIDHQLLFPNKLFNDPQQWVSKKWYQAFVDAGVTRKFSHITFIPADSKYGLLITRFDQPNTKRILGDSTMNLLRVSGQKIINFEEPALHDQSLIVSKK